MSASRLFDPHYYVEQNADVRESTHTPYEHYLLYGAREGRVPHPLIAPDFLVEQVGPGANALETYLADAVRLNPHPLFDTAFYLREVGAAGVGHLSPLEHYLTVGALRGLNPHPLFETNRFAQLWPELKASGVNPLVFYLTEPRTWGSLVHPQFDGDWYLKRNTDVRERFINPLEHYWRWGRFEGRPVFLRASRAEEDDTNTRSVNESLARQWRHAGTLEPLVGPPPAKLSSSAFTAGGSEISSSFARFLAELPQPLLQLTLLPDAQSLDRFPVVRGILERRACDTEAGCMVVLLTDEATGPTLSTSFDGTMVVQLRSFFPELKPYEYRGVLGATIMVTRPKEVLVVESTLGWDLLKHSGPALRTLTQLQGYAPSPQRDDFGRRRDIAGRYLSSTFDSLVQVLVDSEAVRRAIADELGLLRGEQNRIVVVPRGDGECGHE